MRRGVTTAFMKALGKEPSLREHFTNLVMDVKRILRESLSREMLIQHHIVRLAINALELDC